MATENRMVMLTGMRDVMFLNLLTMPKASFSLIVNLILGGRFKPQ